MTIGFMGLISALIAERISVGAAMKLFPALLLAGLFSVLYWNFTEQRG